MTDQHRRHVVVFGLDGVRYDTLCAASTPALDSISGAGFLAPVRVNDAAPTISGPGWATVATGVLADRHGIYDNYLDGHRIADHPDFLTRVRTALPARLTYAAADWPQLVRDTHGGPILLGGGFLPNDADPGENLGRWEEAEDLIAWDAGKTLGGRDDVAASFVYFGSPDAVAHTVGMTDEYVVSIERTDQRIGQVLAAIRCRPGFAAEQWTYLAVTDHGQADGGGHGGESEAERTAWIAAAGPTVPSAPPAGLEMADVPAQALSALGIDIRPEWKLTGRPLDRV